jgi:hypothetical protein
MSRDDYGYAPTMDEPVPLDPPDRLERRRLRSEAAWGLGLIGGVLLIVALVASFAA